MQHQLRAGSISTENAVEERRRSTPGTAPGKTDAHDHRAIPVGATQCYGPETESIPTGGAAAYIFGTDPTARVGDRASTAGA